MSSLKTNGVGGAAKEFVDRGRSIVRLEIELALLEIKTKLVRIGVGIGFGAGAAVVAVFALGFLFAAVAAASRSRCPLWARCSIVGVTAARDHSRPRPAGMRSINAGAPPCRRRRSRKAKLTTETLSSNGQ